MQRTALEQAWATVVKPSTKDLRSLCNKLRDPVNNFTLNSILCVSLIQRMKLTER